MLKLFTLPLILCLSFSTGFLLNASAQENRSKADRYLDSLKRLPSFTIYGDNYFTTGTTLEGNPNSMNSDAKFQLGFKQRLTNYALLWDMYLFLTYRQISFWDIYRDSAPFRDNNYNPGLGLGKLIFKNDKLVGGIFFSIEHESNGLDEENSRSWNFIALTYTTQLYRKLYLSVKGWVPWGSLEDNPDLLNFKSYFEPRLTYIPVNRLILEGEFRKSFTSDWRGKIQLSASFRAFKNRNQFLYVQYFNGYAESLLEFDQRSHMIRIGITIKDIIFQAR